MFSKILVICLLTLILRASLAGAKAQAHASMIDDLIDNGDFLKGTIGAMPDNWEIVCPNPALAPVFRLVDTQNSEQSLMAAGNGRRECFGYARCPVQLEANKT